MSLQETASAPIWKLEESTLEKEGPLLVSKTVKIASLLESEELRDLLHAFQEPVAFFACHGVIKKSSGIALSEDFMALYEEYLSFLKKGENPPSSFRAAFSHFLSKDPQALYSIAVDDSHHIIKARQPIIQVQLHEITYSTEDDSFRSACYGEGGLSWGLQFSYPQLFQDAKTHDIFKVNESFSNSSIFRTLQQWMRTHTVPTPFIIGDKRINVPIRLGKKCFSWISRHPKLIEKKISVHRAH